jgi:hypothetical protein
MTTKQEINNLIQLANGTTVVDVLAPFKQAYTAIVNLYQRAKQDVISNSAMFDYFLDSSCSSFPHPHSYKEPHYTNAFVFFNVGGKARHYLFLIEELLIVEFIDDKCNFLDLSPTKVNNKAAYKQILIRFVKNINNDYVAKNLHFTQFAIDYIEANEQLKCEQGYSAIYQSYKKDKCLPYSYYSVGSATNENQTEKIAFKKLLSFWFNDLFNLSSLKINQLSIELDLSRLAIFREIKVGVQKEIKLDKAKNHDFTRKCENLQEKLENKLDHIGFDFDFKFEKSPTIHYTPYVISKIHYDELGFSIPVKTAPDCSEFHNIHYEIREHNGISYPYYIDFGYYPFKEYDFLFFHHDLDFTEEDIPNYALRNDNMCAFCFGLDTTTELHKMLSKREIFEKIRYSSENMNISPLPTKDKFLKIMSSFYDDFKKLEDMYAQNRNFLINELQSVAGQFEDSEVI